MAGLAWNAAGSGQAPSRGSQLHPVQCRRGEQSWGQQGRGDVNASLHLALAGASQLFPQPSGMLSCAITAPSVLMYDKSIRNCPVSGLEPETKASQLLPPSPRHAHTLVQSLLLMVPTAVLTTPASHHGNRVAVGGASAQSVDQCQMNLPCERQGGGTLETPGL